MLHVQIHHSFVFTYKATILQIYADSVAYAKKEHFD